MLDIVRGCCWLRPPTLKSQPVVCQISKCPRDLDNSEVFEYYEFIGNLKKSKS